MKGFFSNYGWYVVDVVAGLFIIGLLMSLFSNPAIIGSEGFVRLNQTVIGSKVDYTAPTIEEGDFIVENAIVDRYGTYNWGDYVTVSSTNGLDLIDYIVVSGDTVNTSVPGRYNLTFSLNWNGKNIVKKAYVYVRDSF